MSVPTPWPPGAIDQAAEPRAVMAYLDALGVWLAERRHELDRLDQTIRTLPDPAGPTADLMVALSVWQAVETRHQALLTTWDSGRVGPVQLRQLAQLLWSRLDDDPTDAQVTLDRGLSINLAEACRLSDAVTAQLTASLNLSPLAAQLSLRLDGLRAQVERLRDQVRLEPAEGRAARQRDVDGIAAETAELSAKAARGGDIGGLIGPLEIRAARLERDLIVGNAQRRQQRDVRQRADRLRRDLLLREQAIVTLVAEVRRSVTPAPKYAVPQIEALGPVPTEPAALETYAERLNRAGQALDQVEQANRQALTGLRQLRDYLTLLNERNKTRLMADAAPLAAQAADLLARQPAPVEVVKPLLAAYRALLLAKEAS